MYGGRKTKEKGERFFKKAKERHGGESLEVQGVTKLEFQILIYLIHWNYFSIY